MVYHSPLDARYYLYRSLKERIIVLQAESIKKGEFDTVTGTKETRNRYLSTDQTNARWGGGQSFISQPQQTVPDSMRAYSCKW